MGKSGRHYLFWVLLFIPLALWGCGQRLTVEEEQIISAALAAVNGIDRTEYAQFWDSAPGFLRESIDKARWVQQFTYVRQSLGQVRARKFREIELTDRLPDIKETGRYAVVQFGASFDRKKNAVEVVTLAHDPRDGAWKMVGYSLVDAEDRLPRFLRKAIDYIKSFGHGEEDAAREAKAASLIWLASMDRGQAARTWATAGRILREMTDREQWERFVTGFRKELGALISRELRDAVFTRNLPGAPDGRYVIIHYDVVFRNKESAMERLVLVQNDHRKWRVAGYFITEAPGASLNPLSESFSPTRGNPEAERIGTEAQAGWLELMDQGDYPYCWQMGSTLLQAVVSDKNFTRQMELVRRPLGKVLSRELKETSLARNLMNAPDGEYVVALYETTFEKKETVRETVISRKDKDGQWRISGYFIQ